MRYKQIVITGGCGFIGLNLIRILQNTYPYNPIIVVDKLLYDTKKYLPDNVKLHNFDICDMNEMVKVSKNAEIMIHLAANTGVMPSIENPVYDMEVNVNGVVSCLEACRKNKIDKFIYASSGAALGDQIPPIHENMIPKPLSPYGASKMSGENYCNAYYGTFGVETIAFRFSNVYGPLSWHKNSIVSKYIKALLNGDKEFPIYGDGNQTRDFIYVDDLTDAIIKAAFSNVGGEVFQLATGVPTTINEVIEKMAILGKDIFGKTIITIPQDIRKGEVIYNHAKIDKISSMLDFKPRYDITKGLVKTFEWFKYDNHKDK